MTTTSSDVNATGNGEHSAPDTETRSECFEINRHRDGAIFKVRYREGSLSRPCLLDETQIRRLEP